MNYLNKYAKPYSYIFLSAYLFLVSLTIFHYHHYDFQQGNYELEQSPEHQTTNPFDKYFELNGECIVAHFTNTINNFNYVPVLSSEAANHKVYFSLIYNSKLSNQKYNYNHYLRAPPSKLS